MFGSHHGVIPVMVLAVLLSGCATGSRYENEMHLNDELATSFTKPNSLYNSIERNSEHDLPNPVW